MHFLWVGVYQTIWVAPKSLLAFQSYVLCRTKGNAELERDANRKPASCIWHFSCSKWSSLQAAGKSSSFSDLWLLSTGSAWGKEEICRWKCNDMLWFLMLLSSSSSQGPFSQPYNLLLQPLNWGSNDSILTKEKLHLTCIRSEQCPLVIFVLLQALIISATLLGFSQHLLAILLPRRAAPDPENLGGCHCQRGVTENNPVEKAGSLSHFCPQE